MPGEELWLELRLKLLADAALVGFPNAGKSSLLRRISNAKPKVAEYPFTTLAPVLGTVDGTDGRQLTVADVPGLIEGASEGVGLGHEFLAHLERARLLVHVIDASEDAAERFVAINRELEHYGAGLESLPQVVVLNKIDLLSEAPAFDDGITGDPLFCRPWTLLGVPAQPYHSSGQYAESRYLRCFIAAFEEPLHAEADAEERRPAADRGSNRVAPGSDQRFRRREVADARHDHRREPRELAGCRRSRELSAERRECLTHGRQVAGAVVDKGDHSRPFVLGNIFARRASRAQATRSARPNALNTAST